MKANTIAKIVGIASGICLGIGVISAIMVSTTVAKNSIVSSPSSEVPMPTRGNIAAGKYSTTICTQADNLDGWPIQEVMNDWNHNGKNIFTFSTMDCDANVVMQQATVDKNAWASTTFFDSGIISVTLSSEVPVEYRKHVICHEFAHVMGIQHTQDQSCSNIELTVPTPSEDEIRRSGSKLWNWRTARANALQGGR